MRPLSIARISNFLTGCTESPPAASRRMPCVALPAGVTSPHRRMAVRDWQVLAVGGLRAAFEADHGEHRRHGCATGSSFFLSLAH